MSDSFTQSAISLTFHFLEFKDNISGLTPILEEILGLEVKFYSSYFPKVSAGFSGRLLSSAHFFDYFSILYLFKLTYLNTRPKLNALEPSSIPSFKLFLAKAVWTARSLIVRSVNSLSGLVFPANSSFLIVPSKIIVLSRILSRKA